MEEQRQRQEARRNQAGSPAKERPPPIEEGKNMINSICNFLY